MKLNVSSLKNINKIDRTVNTLIKKKLKFLKPVTKENTLLSILQKHKALYRSIINN